MRMFISVFICKFLTKLSKLLGRGGSVLGGYVSLKIYPKILSKIKILENNNYTVAYNKNGSNVYSAIASLIINNTSFKGVFKKDVLLMELDERYLSKVVSSITLTHLVITNITRDQPPRNAHPEFIRDVIKPSINNKTHLIINADDPLVKSLVINHKGKITTYGLDKNNYSVPTKLNNIDASYCPVCKTKLHYEFYHYGHIGSYYCPNCDFKRGNIDYLAHNINILNGYIYINKVKVHLPSNFLYSVYFTTAAFALSKTLKIKDEDIIKVTNDPSFIPKRVNIYNFYGRTWQMLASKNENNLSYKQSLDFIIHEKGKKTVILGFDNSSRRYTENDISWIWDIDFEELNDKRIDKIILVGRFKYDMLVRMEYTGILKSKIILVDNLEKDLISILKNKTSGSIYSCVCFDKEIELKSLLKKEGISNVQN